MPKQKHPTNHPTERKAFLAGKVRLHLAGALPLVLWLLLGMTATHAHAQQVAIKTNGLMLAATTPNLGCEFVTGERSTIDLSLFAGKSIWGNEAKIYGAAPEYRYWFNGRPMTREYVGIAAIGATYDITWGNKRFEGDAAGAGITLGYVLNLSKRLNVEFTGGVGAIYFSQKKYYKNDNMEDFNEQGIVQANDKGYKLLPLKLGVSITYIIK